MTTTDHTLVVGVDIGGTKVAAGVVNRNGEIQKQIRTPMVANKTATEGLAAVVSAIDLLLGHGADTRDLTVSYTHLTLPTILRV